MPADIAAQKAKLEKETGKKYKYRPAKKDLPNISHMLAHGAPETQGKPKSWTQLVGYPLLLALTFLVSLLIFHHAPHSKSVGKSHALPKMGGAKRPISTRQRRQPGMQIVQEAEKVDTYPPVETLSDEAVKEPKEPVAAALNPDEL